MTIADNYKMLLLAILYQAQLDYRDNTLKICKYKDKIRSLESKEHKSADDYNDIQECESKIKLSEYNKKSILDYWDNSTLLYHDMINDELGLKRFSEIEHKAIKDYATGTYRKGRIKK